MKMHNKIYLAAILMLLVAPAQAAGFSDWAAIVVAADNRSGDQGPSEVFDNGRREIAAGLEGIGFSPDNVLQFSVQPEKYPGETLLESSPQIIGDQLFALSQRAPAGCFVYFTSHGSPQGIWVRDGIMPPAVLATMLEDTCGTRPTVAVISACYSGVFVLDLMGDNKLVFTAARRDRASFGCGATDEHTYFDSCFLQSLPNAGNFDRLGVETKNCVSALENRIGAPPSEPQFIAGFGLIEKLPTWTAPAEAAPPGNQ